MELFGMVLAMPAAFVASAVYTVALRFVLRRWRLGSVAFWCSVAVLAGLVAEWGALASQGPVKLQAQTEGAFFSLHLALFFLSVPALATIVVVKRGETWLGSWIAVGVLCAALALPFVVTQYAVSEALFGID